MHVSSISSQKNPLGRVGHRKRKKKNEIFLLAAALFAAAGSAAVAFAPVLSDLRVPPKATYEEEKNKEICMNIYRFVSILGTPEMVL